MSILFKPVMLDVAIVTRDKPGRGEFLFIEQLVWSLSNTVAVKW